MGDKVFAHQPAEGVLQLHGLDEEVMLGIEVRRAHGRFEIEAEPFLNAVQAGALCEVEEKHQVENDGRGEDGVAAEKVHLDLHGVAEPAEDVNVVPALFVVAARGVVVDAHLVVDFAVQLGIKMRLENIFEDAELGFFLGLERTGVVEDFAIAIAEDVGGKPATSSAIAMAKSSTTDRKSTRLNSSHGYISYAVFCLKKKKKSKEKSKDTSTL